MCSLFFLRGLNYRVTKLLFAIMRSFVGNLNGSAAQATSHLWITISRPAKQSVLKH